MEGKRRWTSGWVNEVEDEEDDRCFMEFLVEIWMQPL